jgi:hypothetical protein
MKLVCLWAREVKADTFVDVSAIGSALPNGIPIDLQAQLTVEAVTGTFFNPGLAVSFTGTVYEMTGITGTLNGNPIAFFKDPLGDGSWLNLDLSLGAFYFSAGSNECWLENEGDYPLIAIITDNGAGGGGIGNGTPINYHANLVSTPEPTTVGLLLLGIGSAFALRRRATSRLEDGLRFGVLRFCTAPKDYANPIEPSSIGGEKIAKAIVALVVGRLDQMRGPRIFCLEQCQQPVFQIPNGHVVSYPTSEDRASGYNAFETPSSKAAIDLRPCRAFYGPNRNRAFRSELRDFGTAEAVPSPRP